LNTAEDHFSFIRFEDGTLTGEFLEQSRPVSIAVSEDIFPIDENSQHDNHNAHKPVKDSFHETDKPVCLLSDWSIAGIRNRRIRRSFIHGSLNLYTNILKCEVE
jgi:hypothetical protein